MQNLQSLRCPHCGAPLPATTGTEIITCSYCGVSQQRVDMEKYIAQLRADVYGWVRSIVPNATMNVATVDPVARAQIFEQSIRTQVTARMGSVNMRLLKIGSGPLFLPPFATAFQGMAPGGTAEPKQMLSEAAKYQGLAPFAQSEDQVGFLSEAVASLETLGYLSNVFRIYSEPSQRSYRTVSKNFESAAATLGADKARSGAALRMKGLAALSEGTALTIEGNVKEAGTKFGDAEKALGDAQSEAMRQPPITSWYPGIKAERGMVESMKMVLDALNASMSYGPGSTDALGKLERYVKGFERAKSGSGKVLLSGEKMEAETFRELSAFYRDVMLAKSGAPSVYALGSGGVWVGCWLADLSYSFETGALFMKKGQAVQERLLVSGTFTLMPQYIASQPQALVTDIFTVRSESSFSDRMLGREKTLTTGVGYAALGRARQTHIPSPSSVIPPLCTKAEAEKMAAIYSEKVRQRLQGKLRIGIPSVTRLVYVGGTISKGYLSVPGLPNAMCPYVGDQNALLVYAL